MTSKKRTPIVVDLERLKPVRKGVEVRNSPPSRAVSPSSPATGSKPPSAEYKGFIQVGSPAESRTHDQIPGLIPRAGVLLSVGPPGVSQPALIDQLAIHFSGRAITPLGAVHHPGDVLVISHTLAENDFLRRNAPVANQPCGRVFSHGIERRFNWHKPMLHLESVLKHVDPGSVSAILIDAGHLSSGVNDSVAEAAMVELHKVGVQKRCIVVIFVESLLHSPNPFGRIPRALRVFRDTLLTCALRPVIIDQASPPSAEFLLFKLVHRTVLARTLRFSLGPELNGSGITAYWKDVGLIEPSQALLSANTDDLRGAQLVAAEFARDTILQRGFLSTEELQAIGLLEKGIPKCTMRDALTAARGCQYLYLWGARSGKEWGVPGMIHPTSGFRFFPLIRRRGRN